MNPHCLNCGKIVVLKAGYTTEITSNKPVFGSPDNNIYLCLACESHIEAIKIISWYVSHRIV